MPAYAVIGGQWGDEGKGKVVDYLADNIQALNPALNPKISTAADAVVRANGGNNAGHTIWNPLGEFKLHLVPAGIVNPRVRISIIGPGVVIDPYTIDREHENPELRGEFQIIRDMLGVPIEDFVKLVRFSNKAHLVFQWHIAEDFCQEVLRAIETRRDQGEKDFMLALTDIESLGTTRRGIGPAYADKYSRFGIRIEDLLRDERKIINQLTLAWDRKVRMLERFYLDRREISLEIKNEAWRILGNFKAIQEKIFEFREKFHECFANVERMLYEANRAGQNILFEGAQGFLLDIEHGTYPYVTSSNCGIAGLYDCGITKFDEIIGVFKAYCTRVGNGELTTEMIDDEDVKIAEAIREVAQEYGATTGRARRIGWFDAAAARHSAMLNGMTGFAMTRADIFDSVDLGSAKKIKIGIGYSCNHNGPWKQKDFPSLSDIYCGDFDHWRQDSKVDLAYEVMQSWGPIPVGSRRKRVFDARDFQDLPFAARAYIRRIKKLIGIPVRIISTGPKRDQTIILPSR